MGGARLAFAGDAGQTQQAPEHCSSDGARQLLRQQGVLFTVTELMAVANQSQHQYCKVSHTHNTFYLITSDVDSFSSSFLCFSGKNHTISTHSCRNYNLSETFFGVIDWQKESAFIRKEVDEMAALPNGTMFR